MHIIAKRTLREFATNHPSAWLPLMQWHTTMQHCHAQSFAELKTTFGSADWVNGWIVFDIGGNKYRLVVDVEFRVQQVYVKHVFTHKEYDKWKP